MAREMLKREKESEQERETEIETERERERGEGQGGGRVQRQEAHVGPSRCIMSNTWREYPVLRERGGGVTTCRCRHTYGNITRWSALTKTSMGSNCDVLDLWSTSVVDCVI